MVGDSEGLELACGLEGDRTGDPFPSAFATHTGRLAGCDEPNKDFFPSGPIQVTMANH